MDNTNGRVLLDITECYKNLPEDAVILREFRMNEEQRTLVVTDSFKNLNEAMIEHSFTIEPEFAVSVNKNDVTMSNGNTRVNLTSNTPFEAHNAICCVPGSQNRLRLLHGIKLSSDVEQKVEFTFAVRK